MTDTPDLSALVAATQSFTLGLQRSFAFTPAGVLYVQSTHGQDTVQDLWCLPITEDGFGSPYCVVDAHAQDTGPLSAEEAARRERVRERAQGIVAYSVSKDGTRCAFTWGDGIGVVNPMTCEWLTTLTPPGIMAQPTLSPDGSTVAGVIDGALWLIDVSTGQSSCLAHEDGPVTWGLADFIAAEEMGRYDGFWWAPDSSGLIAARVDNTALTDWWIAAPVDPARPATAMAYPPTGGINATISLSLFGRNGERHDLPFTFGPGHEDEYLVDIQWVDPAHVLVSSQDRRQEQVRTVQWTRADHEVTPVMMTTQRPYVDLIAGLPYGVRTETGLTHCFTVGVVDNERQILLHDQPFGQGQDGWSLSSVTHIDTRGQWRVLANGIPSDEPWRSQGRLISDHGSQSFEGTIWAGLAGPQEELVIVQRLASVANDPMIKIALLDRPGHPMYLLKSLAEPFPRVGVHVHGPLAGEGGIRTFVFVDKTWKRKDGPLPVLVKSYGGPHARMVVDDRSRFGEAAFYATQGYCVIVTDGLGAPGGGMDGEYAIVKNLAATVQGQVDALDLVDHHLPGLIDRSRVGIMGWSYGGYLAARCVLERPDVFRVGLAGAPVTDWRLYDTHYTERYLGHPGEDGEAYDREDLAKIVDGIDGHSWPGRLLLIHGLADDNVVVAHTLRLSGAMLAKGLPHEVLPLSDVTHFTSSATINAMLLRHQLDFLHRYLA